MRTARAALDLKDTKNLNRHQPNDTNPHLVSLATWRHTIAHENPRPSYLKHQFLIAMPHMADPNFAHTLTYIVEHTAMAPWGWWSTDRRS
jgi:putative transcriptional regulator